MDLLCPIADNPEDDSEMVIESTLATPSRKLRGLPGGEGLDGKKHQHLTERRRPKVDRSATTPLKHKQNSPGAPTKPYDSLGDGYQDRYALHYCFVLSA